MVHVPWLNVVKACDCVWPVITSHQALNATKSLCNPVQEITELRWRTWRIRTRMALQYQYLIHATRRSANRHIADATYFTL